LVIVDTHVHVGLDQYVPLGVLLKQIDRSGVEKAVLVQYSAGHPSPGNINNTYICQCAREYPHRLVAVGMVDWTKEYALEVLEYWVKEQGIQGIRMAGTAKSPGANKYAIWEKAAELGINISVTGNLKPIAEIAERFLDLNLQIEHCGMPSINGDVVLNLSKHPNVSVKFSLAGLQELSHQPYPHRNTHTFFKRIYNSFGPERIMWGSDFPPCLEYASYEECLDFIRKKIEYLTEEDKDYILGKTTLKMYRFQ